jgi:hypothetical protein
MENQSYLSRLLVREQESQRRRRNKLSVQKIYGNGGHRDGRLYSQRDINGHREGEGRAKGDLERSVPVHDKPHSDGRKVRFDANVEYRSDSNRSFSNSQDSNKEGEGRPSPPTANRSKRDATSHARSHATHSTPGKHRTVTNKSPSARQMAAPLLRTSEKASINHATHSTPSKHRTVTNKSPSARHMAAPLLRTSQKASVNHATHRSSHSHRTSTSTHRSDVKNETQTPRPSKFVSSGPFHFSGPKPNIGSRDHARTRIPNPYSGFTTSGFTTSAASGRSSRGRYEEKVSSGGAHKHSSKGAAAKRPSDR